MKVGGIPNQRSGVPIWVSAKFKKRSEWVDRDSGRLG